VCDLHSEPQARHHGAWEGTGRGHGEGSELSSEAVEKLSTD
jgi:hypothetical protein